MTITYSLSPQLEELVQQKVASGHFADASEMIEEALRQMDEQDRLERFAKRLRRW